MTTPRGSRVQGRGRSKGRNDGKGGVGETYEYRREPRGTSPSGKKDQPYCKAWVKNKGCTLGDKCNFYHTPECTWYKKGKCFAGQQCQFLHLEEANVNAHANAGMTVAAGNTPRQDLSPSTAYRQDANVGLGEVAVTAMPAESPSASLPPGTRINLGTAGYGPVIRIVPAQPPPVLEVCPQATYDPNSGYTSSGQTFVPGKERPKPQPRSKRTPKPKEYKPNPAYDHIIRRVPAQPQPEVFRD